VNTDQDIKHKVVILNVNQFLSDLESTQLNNTLNSPIPVKYHAYPSSVEKLSLKDLSVNVILFSSVFYLLFKLFKTGNSKIGITKLKSTSQALKDSNKKSSESDKVKAKAEPVEKKGIKFDDVAGLNESKKEIVEFVDFLKNPEKYHKLGAKIPRGALLVGPPGTGKTLLAKAVAGEAGVPFFSMSGSEFVEMYVGVGASRVRDLFKKAKEKSPSIIFIDEIDAVGKKRSQGNSHGGNDERENTLNQLLVEMDGFGTDNTVIVLAATNRQDILDPALLRPGRFDRTVEINLPDRKDREDILKIYLNKVKLNEEKTIAEYAHRISTLTPGFSGAELSNLVNEAAIISARENKPSIDSKSFEKASDRIIAGLETKRILSQKERKVVAYHESGHAVVGWMLEHSNPLVKVTIVPRSKGSLGFAQYIPDDVSLQSKEQLLELMCVSLGGRVAEEIFFNQITTGASDDLRRVSSIARNIVVKYGMSDLGLLTFASGEDSFNKPYSTETEREIEREMMNIINECLKKTRKLVTDNKEKIDKMALKLLDKETLDLIDIIEVLGDRKYPLPDSITEYLDEIKKRKIREDEKKNETDEKQLENNDEIPSQREIAFFKKNEEIHL
jgi:AFG3 family protein